MSTGFYSVSPGMQISWRRRTRIPPNSSWVVDKDDVSAVGDALSESDELNRSLAVGSPDDTRRHQLTMYINEWYVL